MSSIEIRGFRLHRQSISHFLAAGPLHLPLEMELTPVSGVVVLLLRQLLQQLLVHHFPLDSLDRRRKHKRKSNGSKMKMDVLFTLKDLKSPKTRLIKPPKKKRNLFICKQNRAKKSCHQMRNQQQSTYGPYFPSCRAPE